MRRRKARSHGFTAQPSADKITDWLGKINEALQQGTMVQGGMSKLSGALQWGACEMFHRMGRAALRRAVQKPQRASPQAALLVAQATLCACEWV